MPELPEVETVKNTLDHLVNGKTIKDIDIISRGVITTCKGIFINYGDTIWNMNFNIFFNVKEIFLNHF